MTRTIVALLFLGLVLAAPSSLRAAPRHELVGTVQKTARGARVKLRLVPEGGYDSVTLGIAPGHVNRGGAIRRFFEQGLKLSGPTERTYEIPYGRDFKSGAPFTLISRWPEPGFPRDHTWGDAALTLP